MAIELLAIVQAEQQAEALVKEANDRKQALLRQALAQRELMLKSLKAPEPQPVELRQPDLKLRALAETARRNKAKAVGVILEGFYAP